MSTKYEPISQADFPDTGWLKIDSSKYSGAKTKFNGVEFIFLARKHDGVGLHRLQQSLSLIWPKLIEKFPIKIPTITIVDADLPMGSGALMPFAVGVYLGTRDFEKTQVDYVRAVLGWDTVDPDRSEVELRLKRKWSDGPESLIFSQCDFGERLAGIIPPAWFNLTRFHGVFATNHA